MTLSAMDDKTSMRSTTSSAGGAAANTDRDNDAAVPLFLEPLGGPDLVLDANVTTLRLDVVARMTVGLG